MTNQAEEPFKKNETLEIKGTKYVLSAFSKVGSNEYFHLILKRPNGKALYCATAYDKTRIGNVTRL